MTSERETILPSTSLRLIFKNIFIIVIIISLLFFFCILIIPTFKWVFPKKFLQ